MRALWLLLTLATHSTQARERTVADVVKTFGPAADERLAPHFQRAGVKFPPKKVLLVGLKEEKRFELWARDGKDWRFIRAYGITAASGVTGPKLRLGDLQVPEGLYELVNLNPNSSYHLSMRVNYPNPIDRKWAAKEGRTKPGGDIYIHGKDVSIGCIALGDEAIEELFTLVARVGVRTTRLLIAPHDLRTRDAPPPRPEWMKSVYAQLTEELRALDCQGACAEALTTSR